MLDLGNVIYILIGLAVGIVLAVISSFITFRKGINYRRKIAEAEIGSAEQESQRLVGEGVKQAESKKREALLQAKEEIHKSRVELEKDIKDRRAEIQRQERRILQKEENMDRKIEGLEQKDEALAGKIREAQHAYEKANGVLQEHMRELERISGLSIDDAKAYLLKNVESEVQHEMAILIKDNEARAREESDKKAKEIIAGAVQKCAADHVAEITVSVVPLPNDEMKGRIIGREGRNIRALETLTGIEFIIDDTPEAVILSGFDPIRREVARISLEKLIVDGRIHPARIEETVEKSRKEVDAKIRQIGDQATFDTGVHGLHPELVRLLGRLRYRTSYGQNVLLHSIEVCRLTGLMAAELGLDVTLAKRCGLLHDIGKALDHENEGSHIALGAEVARKYREPNDVINSIMSHHGDVDATSTIAILVQAADSISAARPGARRETIESYIKRIEKLEEIANSFPGIEKSFAIQAGREVRIIVNPENISDDAMVLKAREIATKIKEELDYPGQIKVHLIRETRVTEYAK
ncbi:MAG: ribonuclease Y [Clostridiales bacterium]|nr:ribonuclease Y [Clostridiales bacterium]